MTTDAADVAALIRTLAAAPAHVVGVSYSAAVGFALAASNPDLVQSLAAVEPPPCGTPHAPDFLEANRQLLKTHASMGPQAALEQFMATLVGSEWREVSERAMAGSVAAMERDAATFFGSDVPALLTWRFDADDAARIECPVLLINGSTSSPWFSEMRTRVLHLLPHAEDMAVAGAGHLLGSTHCDELAALLLEQLTRHPRSDRRAPSEHSRT